MSKPALHGPGFATTTPFDHRAWIWVAGFLSLIYSLLCLAARLVAKWGLLWYDDAILAAGYVSAITHWALLFTSISDGLAVSTIALSSEALTHAAQAYFGARIPLLLSHCFAKLSMLVFTRRIFVGDIYKENLFFAISYAVAVLYGVLAILLSSAGCHPGQVLVASTNAVCHHNIARWTVITAFDGLTELIILVIPVWFIGRNQLKASKKRVVVFVYMFRLVVIAFTVAATASYFNFLDHGRDNIGIASTVAWQETLLSFSLISASVPCLRTFIWAFMSRGLMTMYGNTTVSTSASRSASVHLRSLNKSQHPSRQDSETGESRVRLRPEQTGYHVNVTHGQGAAQQDPRRVNTSSADDSDRMIIHQETTYRVDSIRV